MSQVWQEAKESSRLPFTQNISLFPWVRKVGEKMTKDQNFKAVRAFAALNYEEKPSESTAAGQLWQTLQAQLKSPGPVWSSWAASDWLKYIIYSCPEPQNNFSFCSLQAFPLKGGIYNPSGCGVVSPPSQQRVPGRNWRWIFTSEISQ